MVGALLGVLGGLATNAQNNSLAQQNADTSYKRQRELMALQNQYAVENWYRENNYNTPEAQKERLKAAGLNPNLMYGNGASGLMAGSVAAPSAPSAPMAQTIPMGNIAVEGAAVAQGIQNAKKAGSETVAQEIENQFLAKKFYQEISLLVSKEKESGSNIKLNEARMSNLAQATANLQVEADALKTRLGYEKVDRLISAFDSTVKAMVAQNEITDSEATRHARIFSLTARGNLDEANSYIVGLFKDPEKAKSWVKSWAKTLKATYAEVFGKNKGKDSKGRSTFNPFNSNPDSEASNAARSIFGAIDNWICSWTGADPVIFD